MNAKPESLAGALGVGAVIVITLATGLAVLFQRARPLDADATFAAWFQPAELPFGLRPVEAARHGSGWVQLRLADPDAAPEPERSEPPEPSEPVADAPPPPPFDWGAIPIGPAGAPPSEALFETWPVQAARGQLASLFEMRQRATPGDLREQSRTRDPLEGLGPDGGRRVLATGRLPWGAFDAPYVHEREFERGGTFVDTLRLNLSSEREALVLFLRWPRGLPASEERAGELLAALARVDDAATLGEPTSGR